MKKKATAAGCLNGTGDTRTGADWLRGEVVRCRRSGAGCRRVAQLHVLPTSNLATRQMHVLPLATTSFVHELRALAPCDRASDMMSYRQRAFRPEKNK